MYCVWFVAVTTSKWDMFDQYGGDSDSEEEDQQPPPNSNSKATDEYNEDLDGMLVCLSFCIVLQLYF